jgi:hypothetical protein
MKIVNGQSLPSGSDLILEEIWRTKDETAAKYKGDIKMYFRDLREAEKKSGHPIVSRDE